VVRNAILDKNVVVPDGFQLGVNDKDADLKRVTITEEGIRIVAKGTTIEL
jgi:glucose-1-phosphate adenylyltransferase